MANKSFDFNKIKRSFFNATLKDGRKLIVKMPMKKTFEKITTIQEMDEETAMDDVLEAFGGLCAEILSNNMKGERVTPDYMIDNYDLEEMQIFITAFYEFVSGATNNPN